MKNDVILQQINSALLSLQNGAENKQQAQNLLSELYNNIYESNEETLLHPLGLLALKLQSLAEATNIFAKLLDLQPESCIYLDQMAQCYLQKHRYQEAIYLLKQALEIKPDYTYALINLGAAYKQIRQYEKAVEYLQKAQLTSPNDAALIVNLATCWNTLGKTKESLKLVNHGCKLHPNNTNLLYTKAVIQGQYGKHNQAIESYLQALEINPNIGACFYGIAELKKFTSDDEYLIHRALDALKNNLPKEDRYSIDFFLGKAYNDLKEWDKAYHYYSKGNTLKKPGLIETAPRKQVKLIAKLTQESTAFNTANLTKNQKSITPIFIVGMPRSGSTLTEQIINAHPETSSIGETTFTNTNLLTPLFTKLKTQDKKQIQDFYLETCNDYAPKYLDMLSSGATPGTSYVIDKTPGNFFIISLLKKLLPNAKFIHTMRHPLDNCLSCFFQPFNAIAWSHSLEDIADNYCFYRETMNLWQKTLPTEAILNISYEELVDNNERQARRILEYCGLNWDPSCLEFYKKDTNVRTASVWQAKQPIYKSSKQRWLNYATHLMPLINQVSPYLSNDDVSLLKSSNLNLSLNAKLKRSLLRA